MCFQCLLFALLPAAVPEAGGRVSYPATPVSYDGTCYPEEADPPWERETWCEPWRGFEDGCLVQIVESGQCGDPPSGDSDYYNQTIHEFDGAPAFFVEWRVHAEGDSSEIPWGGPAAFAAYSFGPVNYTFFIADDLVKLNRDNLLPIVFVDITPGMAHTHRLELYGADLYVWYIDGEVVDAGVPEGAYPSAYPAIAWHAQSAYLFNTVKWDYIKYGIISNDGGDPQTEELGADDFYYSHGPSSQRDAKAGADHGADEGLPAAPPLDHRYDYQGP